MQAPHVLWGVGDGDAFGEVAHHCGDGVVAHFLGVAGGLDETWRGAMRAVCARPGFGPGKDGQRRARQPPLGSLGQVEAARSVLVGFAAFVAEVQRQGDMAVERDDAFLQVVGLTNDFPGVAARGREMVPGSQTGTRGDCRSQADVQGFFPAWCRHLGLGRFAVEGGHRGRRYLG
ncbi:hypothetical protein D9M71_485330 [compost metagenome]